MLDHEDVQPFQSVAPDAGETAGMTASLTARVLQDILDIVHAQPVLGNVLDVAFRVVRIVSQDTKEVHLGLGQQW